MDWHETDVEIIREFKIAMINLLWTLTKKNRQCGRTDGLDGKTKKELRVNARNQKHWNRFEESFGHLISILDTAEEKINELEYMTIETSQT